MRALNRKLMRDLVHLRGQLIAIAVVTSTGVATIVATRTGYESLVASQASYYETYRFADVFAHLKRAPNALLRRIAATDGVEEIEARVVEEVTLDVPGLAEPATGRLVSVPEHRRPLLNDVHLKRGRYLAPGRRNEVLASDAFAEANGLDVGDTIGAVINGRWERLRVVGVALSPEYIYEIRGAELFPDNKRFGVLWMSRDALGPAFQMEGGFNDLALALTPGADEDEVIVQLDRLLEPHGGLGAYGRRDHVSHRFVTDEIAQDRVSGTLIPVIFLGIAAFLLHVVLSRLVATQRDQIGVLKAFGYDNRSVALHYLGLGMAALALGGIAGVGLGMWWGDWINDTYAQYYRFPAYSYRMSTTAVVLGLTVTTVAALAGALAGVRRVVTLPPAEAMRPEAPEGFRPGVAERFGALGVAGRMIVRNVARQPAKAFVSVFGIALAAAILVLGRSLMDAIARIADVQFRMVQRESLAVGFDAPRPGRVRYELARLPGTLRAEVMRVIPARLRHEHRVRRIGIVGLEPESELRLLVTRTLVTVPLPPEGLVLTAKLGEVLRVGAGDTLTVEILEGERKIRRAPVVGLVDELLGLTAYMSAPALDRLTGGGAVSAALLRTDPAGHEELFAYLKRTPRAAGVTSRDAVLASFNQTLAQSIGIFTSVIVGFASALGAAVVYNSARLALSERGRELASLRVLGFTRGEVARMLLGEQALLTAIAIPAGLALGYAFAAALVRNYQWELYRIPLVVSLESYLLATGVVLGAAALSGLIVRRRLDRMDLVEILKTRE